ncbi:MAG: aldehyde dehydrogenase family protein [Bryobacterales bacterium]|nr:aldehyde dehydrogenase family protein [Bryobacteraceae bacterium]MDW8129972.1 aldehyde dehydrogenase family protein [Bryobacterales bacterium]
MPEEQEQAAVQEARSKVARAYAAFCKYRLFSQQQIDEIVEAMAEAGRANARRLAEMAVEETGYGNVKDKIAKNLLNADLLARTIRGMKTVGVLREIPEEKIVEIGVPCGVVAAIVPCTNPTSTVIYKALISLKAGNTIVVSPHPRAVRCTRETADLLYEAARKAGAPEDVLLCLERPTLEATQALMRHEHTAVILATGGHGMVRAAYSSGKPAFGVGPGNVPVLLDTSFPVPEAVAGIVEGKAFDYGTVCSSEQTLVAEQSLREPVLAALRTQKAYLCSEEQKEALARVLVRPNLQINPDCVGQAPTKLARMAGFEVPPDTSILVVELAGVGKEHPLSVEKLSPVLALRFVRDFEEALQTCEAVLRFGGLGHTCVIWSKDEARIREFGARMPAFRVLVNTPGPHGSVGITTRLMPAMTLGCGAMGGNSTSDNVGPQHLINIKRVAWKVREAAEALPLPPYEEKRAPVEPPAPAIAALDRAAIAAAVEQYLRERGLAAAQASLPAAAADIVDRFLAARGKAPAACPRRSAVCPTATPSGPSATEPTPPAQPVLIADFVCEADVRAALQQGRKIFIGPRTIVTPAARDLGEQHGVLVMTQG